MFGAATQSTCLAVCVRVHGTERCGLSAVLNRTLQTGNFSFESNEPPSIIGRYKSNLNGISDQTG